MQEIMALYLVLMTPGALPPLVWGAPGIGKSARMKSIAKSLGLILETVIASIREPQDFGGMPIPDEDGNVRMAPPDWAKRLHKAGKGLLFIDEESCTPPATQAALLRVVHEGMVGELQLPDEVKRCGAANPPDQAAGGWDLALPLANRHWHTVWARPSSKDWSEWLLGGSKDGDLPKFDLADWERSFNRAKTLAVGFMRKFPEMLNEDPASLAGRFPMAYATPRSWECAVRLYATVLCTGQHDYALQLMMGAVGEAVATQFLAWVRDADLPDPEALLKDPSSYNPDAGRPDAVFATLNMVVYAAIEKQQSPQVYLQRWKAAWEVLDRAMKIGKDIVVVAARKLAAEANRPKGGLSDPKVLKIVGQLKDVVRESGLMS